MDVAEIVAARKIVKTQKFRLGRFWYLARSAYHFRSPECGLGRNYIYLVKG